MQCPNGGWACLDDNSTKEWELEQVLNNRPATFTPYIFIYNRQPYHPWPKDDSTLGIIQPGGNFSIRELSEPLASGQVEPSPSNRDSLFDGSIERPTPPNEIPIDEEENNVQVQAGVSLPEISEPNGIDEENGRPRSRWEGQPAEIVVQVTMGDMVLTGVLRGLMIKGPKRHSLGAKPTGISKRPTSKPPPASCQWRRIPKSSEVN